MPGSCFHRKCICCVMREAIAARINLSIHHDDSLLRVSVLSNRRDLLRHVPFLRRSPGFHHWRRC